MCIAVYKGITIWGNFLSEHFHKTKFVYMVLYEMLYGTYIYYISRIFLYMSVVYYMDLGPAILYAWDICNKPTFLTALL